MPDEDREVLRCCHMKLIENIGDVISVCEHLYQHKILDCDDLQEIRSITRKTDRNAHVLRTIQTRGNILDLVIEIMRGKRENQEAAAILQRERFQRTDGKWILTDWRLTFSDNLEFSVVLSTLDEGPFSPARCSGLWVSLLDSRLNIFPGLSAGQACVVFLGKTPNSCSASLHPGVLMGTGKLLGQPDILLGITCDGFKHPIQRE